MKAITNSEQMTSRQIAEVSGKMHKDVLKAIRNMEIAWEKVNGRKFTLVEYVDNKGENRPEYQLTKTECLFIATKFNDEARAKLVLRWEELEKGKIPQTYAQALRAAAEQAERAEALQLKTNNLRQALDTLEEWASIIRIAKHNGVKESQFKWRELKKQSQLMGFEVKKAPSPRFGYQNLYHLSVWKACYPEYDYTLKEVDDHLYGTGLNPKRLNS